MSSDRRVRENHPELMLQDDCVREVLRRRHLLALAQIVGWSGKQARWREFNPRFLKAVRRVLRRT